MTNIKAESVDGKLVITDLDTGRVLDVDQIEITTDSNGTACVGLWSTQFSVQIAVGPVAGPTLSS